MRKAFAVVALLLCLLLALTSCGLFRNIIDKNIPGGKQSNDPNSSEDPNVSQKPGESQAPGITEYTLAAYADLWTDLYDANAPVLNDSGELLIEAAFPSLAFITAGQYDFLNLFNKDGRYEGALLLAGWNGFVEKNGPNFTFGYEGIREEGGWGPSNQVGDKLVEQGNCEINDGHYYVESYTERDGSLIYRTTADFQLMGDGSIICFYMTGEFFDARGNESPHAKTVYIRNGPGRFDIVVAKSDEIGPEFETFLVSQHGDVTKEDAIRMFEEAGYTIDYSGSIVGNAFVLD